MSARVSYSVIVPAYNAGKTIGDCLRALARQSLDAADYEVIVVDDGSRDDTAEIVKTFPVRYLHQENKGPAAARNYGSREARGEIILFTDSDCVPSRDWIAEMAKPFDDPEVVAVKGAYRTNQRSLFARFAQVEFEERFELLKRAASIDMVDTYSAAYRIGVFDRSAGSTNRFRLRTTRTPSFRTSCPAWDERWSLIPMPWSITSTIPIRSSATRGSSSGGDTGAWSCTADTRIR